MVVGFSVDVVHDGVKKVGTLFPKRVPALSFGRNDFLLNVVSDIKAGLFHGSNGRMEVFIEGHEPWKHIDCSAIVNFPKYFVKILAIAGEILVIVVVTFGRAKVAVENVGASFDHQGLQVNLGRAAILGGCNGLMNGPHQMLTLL